MTMLVLNKTIWTLNTTLTAYLLVGWQLTIFLASLLSLAIVLKRPTIVIWSAVMIATAQLVGDWLLMLVVVLSIILLAKTKEMATDLCEKFSAITDEYGPPESVILEWLLFQAR